MGERMENSGVRQILHFHEKRGFCRQALANGKKIRINSVFGCQKNDKKEETLVYFTPN